jgi:hypothetical protein
VLSGGEEKQVVFDLIPRSSSPKTVSNSNPYFVPLAKKQYKKWFNFWGYLGELHYFFDFGAKIVQFPF